MKIIKLNAIASTNSFLKDMVASSVVESFTVVVAKEQTSGRGQVASKWVAEPFKSLTFSVFCVLDDLSVLHQKYLNFAVSLSVFEAVKLLNVPRLTVKWPNDIMSGKKKICGILIENSLKKNKILNAIVGIGLNVNQEVFPADIPNASSIKNSIKQDTDLDYLLSLILERLKVNVDLLNKKSYQELEDKYLRVLYRKDIPSMFKDYQGNLFMGKIIGVSSEGKLQVELENETIQEFGLKEVSFV